jgi:hypothetical protein
MPTMKQEGGRETGNGYGEEAREAVPTFAHAWRKLCPGAPMNKPSRRPRHLAGQSLLPTQIIAQHRHNGQSTYHPSNANTHFV